MLRGMLHAQPPPACGPARDFLILASSWHAQADGRAASPCARESEGDQGDDKDQE